jgi:hypothetical protein
MDRRNLVEGLQRAFNEDDRVRLTEDTADVEYKENTNSLYVKEQKTYNFEHRADQEPVMSEEELFARLLQERR